MLLEAGEYQSALRDPIAIRLLGETPGGDADVADRVRGYLASGESASGAAAVCHLAAASLCLFAQLNWTGPPLQSSESTDMQLAAHGTEAHSNALLTLEVDGEQPYALLCAPTLLCAARALLHGPLDELQTAEGNQWNVRWWAARCAFLHQRCLLGSAPSLEKLATRCMRGVLEAMRTSATGKAVLEPGTGVMVASLEGRPELNGRWRGSHPVQSSPVQ